MGRYINSPWARPMALSDAVALVARVREAAAHGARESLEALAATVHWRSRGSRLRACSPLPANNRRADRRCSRSDHGDSIMYREALADAAAARGWTVKWYDSEHVFQDAAAAGPAAKTSTLFCKRWVGRSAPLGRRSTSSLRRRRLELPRDSAPCPIATGWSRRSALRRSRSSRRALAGSQLHSVLLEVMQRRAGARSLAEVLAQSRRDAFCSPAPVDLREALAIDSAFLAAAASSKRSTYRRSRRSALAPRWRSPTSIECCPRCA